MNNSANDDFDHDVFYCYDGDFQNQVRLLVFGTFKSISKKLLSSQKHEMSDTTGASSPVAEKMSDNDIKPSDPEAPVRRSSRIRRTVVKKDEPFMPRANKKLKNASQGSDTGVIEPHDGHKSLLDNDAVEAKTDKISSKHENSSPKVVDEKKRRRKVNSKDLCSDQSLDAKERTENCQNISCEPKDMNPGLIFDGMDSDSNCFDKSYDALKMLEDHGEYKSSGNNEIKPVKVKSRWWRSSELEGVLKSESSSELPDSKTTHQDGSSFDVEGSNFVTDDKVLNREKDESVLQYEHIDENIYRFNRKKSKCKKQVRRMVCDCTLTKEELETGVKGCKEDCLNRLLMIECGSRCPVGEACSNKNFQKKQNAKVELFLTEKKGWGLRAQETISTGDFVVEFVGEVLNHREYRQRVKQYAKEKNVHSYFMALKTDEILDATSKGNYSRFINHSCDPNCETQKWTVNGELRVGVFAKRGIPIGEELTLDYKFQRYGREAQKCFCGADNCSGFIGGSKTISIDAFRGNNKLRKRKSSDDKKRDVEDFILEEEIEKLNGSRGLRNREDTLNFSRLMIRAEDATTRHQLLDIILKTEEQSCLRLFLGYHGLPLLWSWMTDVAESDLKVKILQVLSTLPITNKTMLLDSKVMSIVEKWKAEPSEALRPAPVSKTQDSLVKRVHEFSDSENDSTGSNTAGCESNVMEAEGPQKTETPGLMSPPSSNLPESETKELCSSPESGLKVDIANLASELLSSWNNLKEVFRIPRLEQQKRKENELEVDMKAEKEVARSPATATTSHSASAFSVHNKCGDHIQVVISGKNVQDQRRGYDYDSPEIKGEDFLRRFNSSRPPILAKPRQIAHPLRSIDSYSRTDISKGSPETPSPTLSAVSPLLPVPNSIPEPTVIHYPPPVSLPPPMAAGNGSSLIYSSPIIYSQSQMPFVNSSLPQNAAGLASPVSSHPSLLQQPSGLPPCQPVGPGGNYLLLPPVAQGPHQPPPFISTPATRFPAPSGMPPFSDPNSPMFLIPPQGVAPGQGNIPFQTTPLPLPPSVVKEEPKPVKLPKNWRSATDEEGNVYYYHSITRETQWDPPSEEDEESDEEESSSEESGSSDTPTYDEPKLVSNAKKKSKRKPTKAAADTSVAPVRPEVAKKIKELFRTKISSFIVHCLNAYRKPSCVVGRITSNEDFKYLARKLTHYTMTKELKQCKNVEDLDCNETVMHKAKDFIKKYMAKYGAQYTRKEKVSPSE